MAKNVVVDTEHMTLWYHPSSRVIHHQFNSLVRGEAFRSFLNEGIALIAKHDADKWLADDRRNTALPREDYHWILKDWQPRSRAAGLRYLAIIYPREKGVCADLSRVVESARDRGLVVELFTEPDEGLAWLQGVG